MQEFDLLDVAYFCHADESHKMYLYWQKQRLRWWKQVGGVNGVGGWSKCLEPGWGHWAESHSFPLYPQYAENPDWFILSERPSEELPTGASNASTIEVRGSVWLVAVYLLSRHTLHKGGSV